MALTNNLAAFWNFNNSLIDEVTSLEWGFWTGTPVSSYAAGKINEGWYINKLSANSLQVATEVWNPGPTDWSVSWWYKYNDGATTSTPDYHLRLSEDGTGVRIGVGVSRFFVGPVFRVNVTVGTTTITLPNYTPDTNWHHVAVSYNASTSLLSAWRNNTLSTFAAFPAATISTVPKLHTGVASLVMDGTIDAMGLWNRQLTADEVAELYNGGNGIELSLVEQAIKINKRGFSNNLPLGF